jgi:hypothetical protein
MDYSVTETDLKLKISFEETVEGVVYKEVTELFSRVTELRGLFPASVLRLS